MTGQPGSGVTDVDHFEPGWLSIAGCPEPGCLALASVYAEAELGSTAGPVRHARTRCLNRHHFQLPVSQVPGLAADNHASEHIRDGLPLRAEINVVGYLARKPEEDVK
jgi:hypothetical protein